MMVIAISASLIVFGGMWYARTLVLSNTTSGYLSTNPASARITLEPGIMPDQTEEFIAAAEKAYARVAPTIDRRLAELNGYRDTLANRVSVALDHAARKTPEGLALAAEVRSHVKAVKKPDERMKFVAQAIDQGDLPTVAAVIHAQPFLSGLDPATHETLRARAAAKFAPVDSAQLAATEAAINHVTTSTSSLVKRLGDIVALRNVPTAKAALSHKALEVAGQ